jgi:hypothetical protein
MSQLGPKFISRKCLQAKVPFSKKTDCHITNMNWVMSFQEVISIYYENHTKRKYTWQYV